MNQLTTTEQKIYNLLVNEATKTKDIAKRLDLSTHTVERKIESLLAKKGVSTQKELIVRHYKAIIEEFTLCPSVSIKNGTL